MIYKRYVWWLSLKYVGIAAYSGPPPDYLVTAAKEFLSELSRLLSPNETVIVVGGYWGLMKVIVDSALDLGFHVLMFPPESMEDLSFPERAIVVKTGTSFRVRSVFLVRTSDVLVAMGGAAGSIQEVVTAYTEGKPVIVLSPMGMPTDKVKHLSPYIDDRKLSKIELVPTPKRLAEKVRDYLIG